MRNTILTAFLLLFTQTLVRGDDPPVVVKTAPSCVPDLPVDASKTTLKNGTTEIQAGTVEQKTDGDTVVVVLGGKPRIKHSSQVNGSITVSADRIRISLPAHRITNLDPVSLSNLDATGSCVFVSDSINISADSISLKASSETVRSSLTFHGNVIITTDGLTATASSVTLSRSGTTWTLSGLLAVPKDGG